MYVGTKTVCRYLQIFVVCWYVFSPYAFECCLFIRYEFIFLTFQKISNLIFYSLVFLFILVLQKGEYSIKTISVSLNIYNFFVTTDLFSFEYVLIPYPSESFLCLVVKYLLIVSWIISLGCITLMVFLCWVFLFIFLFAWFFSLFFLLLFLL